MQNFFEGRVLWWKAIGAVALIFGNMHLAQYAVAAPQTADATNGATETHSASKTVLVLGDSLSAEYGLVRGTGWVPLLTQRIKAEQLDATIVNASISGDTTSGGRARLQALLTRHRPSIVVIELGGNDALRGLAMPATEANMIEMIKASKKIGAKVVLLGMQIPPNYGADYARLFASMYTKVAKNTGVTLVPFFLEGLQTRLDLFQADRIHPVAAAQPMMLDNVWPYLAPLLSSVPAKQAAAK